MENEHTTETASTAATMAVSTVPKAPVAIGNRGVALASLEDLWRFGGIIQSSGLAPK